MHVDRWPHNSVISRAGFEPPAGIGDGCARVGERSSAISRPRLRRRKRRARSNLAAQASPDSALAASVARPGRFFQTTVDWRCRTARTPSMVPMEISRALVRCASFRELRPAAALAFASRAGVAKCKVVFMM